MANNTTLNLASIPGGDALATVDISTFSAYPTTGKVPAGVLYAGAAPAAVTPTNPLPTAAAPVTGQLWSGAVVLTPKFAFVNATASGNTTVVAAVAAKKIRVLSYLAQTDAAVNLYFKSETAGAVSSTKRLLANQPVSKSESHLGQFETAVGEALQINLSAIANVGVDVVYVEV